MAKFELYRSPNGEYRFRLKAANGQTILTSEGYKTKAAAQNGIESVRKNAGREGGTEVYEGQGGKHYFRVKARNGQVVGSSQGYASAAGARKGVEAVQRAADAGVADQTA
ncbi:MAG: YegP family protein [Rhodothermales bacterium]|nr:YegP family protein [Rhodothermales bacterium]